MGAKSAIEWTDATWNPVTGCTRISPGCDHCYIERTPPFRIGSRGFDKPGIGGTTGVQLHPDRLEQPLHWRKPRRVFVNSLSDLFHPDVPDKFITRIFITMECAPLHTFQVLTKRPRRMQSFVSRRYASNIGMANIPPANVWLGVSVENQEWADRRIPLLLETPAAVRFLSCEPLLGPIDLNHVAIPHGLVEINGGHLPGIDWVIVGGESGPDARAMHPNWARSLRDQCVEAGVPFFFKQWGEWAPYRAEFGTDVRSALDDLGTDSLCSFALVGKKRAGRELDGQTWDEMPGSGPL